ncbi:MAG: efflux RND transporter periplasmic adaptor subunit [Thermoguttaceae bacterium]|jgi:RND family efflux transporter MFP subunit
MKYRSRVRAGSALFLGLCLGLTGCSRAPSQAPLAAPVTVAVSYPVEREVTDYADFTARIAAVDSVEVRAHVWGYLQKVNFQEGALVKKGDVLFEIDPRPYQAMLNQAKAKVAQDEAQLAFDEAEYGRNLRLAATKAVSQSDLDKSVAARNVDIANVAADKAVVASRQLDLEYTKVTAPVSGRVSRYHVTVGNLIQSADQASVTLLTTIVSVDPMHAYFDVDERTVQRVRQWIPEGRTKSVRDMGWPVTLGLATEEGFPHQGTINFVDNQLNPKTGTLRVRGVFPNKDEALSAGFFARVRVPTGPPHRALLVSDRALDTDQGQKVLYVVNDKNEVVSRAIRVGLLHDGLRAIEDGLKPGERVVVNGLQLVQPGITVEPKLVDMPASGGKRRASGVGAAIADDRKPRPDR